MLRKQTHPRSLDPMDRRCGETTQVHESIAQFAAQAIGDRLRAITASQSNLADFQVPPGDQGLFGPASMTWRVHANFTAMMVGGLSSLIVQSLHPRALAAVWDHSDFRNQLKARLGRTAHFVAATTYGSQAMALGAIQRVNAIHAHIRGTDLNGQPYGANEPDLLRWVHLAEVNAFLSAYQHLSNRALHRVECDQYIEEMTRVGHLLGAQALPTTWAATQVALADYQTQLQFDARARAILEVVQHYPSDLLDRPFLQLILKAAFDVMPRWALTLIERPSACVLQAQATRFALRLASQPIQWTLDQHGVAAVARQRVFARGAVNGEPVSLHVRDRVDMPKPE